MTTPSPLQTLREALGEISIYAAPARRPNLNRAIARAESALREVEREITYTRAEVVMLLDELDITADQAVEIFKRRLAERGDK